MLVERFKIPTMPAGLNGDYYFLAEVIDSTNLITAVASTFTTNIAPPFVSFSGQITVPPPSTAAIGGYKTRAFAIVEITNNGNIPFTGAVPISLFASLDQTHDSSDALIVAAAPHMGLRVGASHSVHVAFGTIPNITPDAYYTLSQVTNPDNTASVASTGSTLSIVAPVVTLSETLLRLTLPASTVSGGSTKAIAVVKITNSGNIPSNGTTTVALYATTDDQVDDTASLITSAAPHPIIPVNHSALVTLHLTTLPSGLNGDDYAIVAQVTDPLGDVTLTPPSSALYSISPASVTLSATIDSFTPTALSINGTTSGVFSVTITNSGNISVGTAHDVNSFFIGLGLISQLGTQTIQVEPFTYPLVLAPATSRKLTFHFKASDLSSLSTGDFFPTVSISVDQTSYSTAATGTQVILLS